MGTTAGACVNVSQGSTACGAGVCRVTAPVCLNGAPNACVPNWGNASTETCNDIDDNCDGTIDNGSFADGQEPNNACANYRALPTVGSELTLTQNTLTLYPAGDGDYFRINAAETDSYSVYVRITAGNAPGFECRPYTLSYHLNSGVCNNVQVEQGFSIPIAVAPDSNGLQ
jgi:hypothetical protein